MIITNLTEQMMYRILMESIEENYDKEQEDRETKMDLYEGINLQEDLKKYFDSESLSQIPPAYLNLTRSIIEKRAGVYQQQPVRYADQRYLDALGDLNGVMKEFEKLSPASRVVATFKFLEGTHGRVSQRRFTHHLPPVSGRSTGISLLDANTMKKYFNLYNEVLTDAEYRLQRDVREKSDFASYTWLQKKKGCK